MKLQVSLLPWDRIAMVPLSLLLRTPEAVATLSQGQPTFAWQSAGMGVNSTNTASVENRTTGLRRKLASPRKGDRCAHAGECSRWRSPDAVAGSRRSTSVLQGQTSW